MNTIEFNIDADSLERMCNKPAQCQAMIRLLEQFPEEAEASYIKIIGTIDYEYDDDTRVPYGETYATLPPSWHLEHAKITDIVMEEHAIDTGVPNMGKLQIKEKILDFTVLTPEVMKMLGRLVDSYYNENFDEFKDIVKQYDSDYDGDPYDTFDYGY